MYNIRISTIEDEIYIPFNISNNKYKDLYIYNILEKNRDFINTFFINSKKFLDKIYIWLYDGEEKLLEQIITPNIKINFTFSSEHIYNNLNLDNIINNMFEKLEKYIIEVENEEVSKVNLNGCSVDANWFINNIYNKDTGRYYRKIITFNNMCVFTRDIKY